MGIFVCMNMVSFGVHALSVNSSAPNFSLPDQDNRIHTLAEYRGKFVVLYFYPKDDTSICTKQAQAIRDHYDEFKENDIMVLGINYDSPASHKKFQQKLGLPFDLLSDSHKKTAKKYNAEGSWLFLWSVPARKTFIIDPEGVICAIMENVGIDSYAQRILSVIKEKKA